MVVQGPGRLVAQQQLGIFRQGPGDGHPLLLAAGELGGEVVQPLPQSHGAQHLGGIHGILADLGGQLHVLQGRQVGHQVVKLKDKANIVAAVGGQTLGVIGGDLLHAQKDPALGEGVHAAQDIEKGGLSRAAGAYDDAQLPLFHGEGCAAQGLDLHLAHAVDLFDAFKPDKTAHRLTSYVSMCSC